MERKRKLRKYEELWIKIKGLIRSISKNYHDKKYMKIKFNWDDKLPLNKIIEICIMAIFVRAIFQENNFYEKFSKMNVSIYYE